MRNYTTEVVNKSSISSYISKVYNVDYITRAEELKLLEAFVTNGDMVAREKLITANLGNVIKVARTLDGYKVSFLDLVQEGNLGLVKALNKFTLDHDVRFFTFAVHYVKSAMYDFVIKNHKIYNIATTKPLRKLFFSLRRYKNHTGHYSDSEINRASEELNVKPAEIRSMAVRLQPNSVASLDAPLETMGGTSYQEDIGLSQMDLLVAETEQPDEALQNSETQFHLRTAMYAALKTLDVRTKDIVRRRWLDSEKATLSVLSKEYGVSMERIRQIEAMGLRQMRLRMSH